MSGFNQIGEQYNLSVGGNAKTLTLPTNSANETLRPKHAQIWVANFPIRWSAKSTPTATNGMYVPANSYIDWTDPNWDYFGFIKNVKFVGVGGEAILDIVFLD